MVALSVLGNRWSFVSLVRRFDDMLEFHALGFLLLLPPRHPGHGDDDDQQQQAGRRATFKKL